MEKDELQKEAEEMNELGIRKLPRDDDGPDPDKVFSNKLSVSKKELIHLNLEPDVLDFYLLVFFFRANSQSLNYHKS